MVGVEELVMKTVRVIGVLQDTGSPVGHRWENLTCKPWGLRDPGQRLAGVTVPGSRSKEREGFGGNSLHYCERGVAEVRVSHRSEVGLS